MTQVVENLMQHPISPIDDQFDLSEDGYQHPESPGMQKLHHLGATELAAEELEVSAKLVRRPTSTGSAGIGDYTYGTAPKRDLHIAKKHTTALYGVPDDKPHVRPTAAQPLKRDDINMHVNGRLSPSIRALNEASRHGTHPNGLPSQKLCPSVNPKVSDADDPGSGETGEEDTRQSQVEPQDARVSKLHSAPEMPGRTILGQRVDLAPLAKKLSSDLSTMSASRADAERHGDRGTSDELASVGHEKAEGASNSTPMNTKISCLHDQLGCLNEEVGDSTLQDCRSGQVDVAPNSTSENSGTAHVGSLTDNGHSISSEAGREPSEQIGRGLDSQPRASSSPKSPLQPVRPMKVTKRPHKAQPSPLSTPLVTSDTTTGRTPSEEDLYILLLHRYRKREHVEKQLATRLRLLEAENAKLCHAAEDYRQRLETSVTSASRQAAQTRAQKIIIGDIRESNARIKSFMTAIYEDRKVLRAEATSMNQETQRLREERDRLQRDVDEAKQVIQSSGSAMDNMKRHLAEFRQEAGKLEISFRDAKLELKNTQNLLSEERRKAMRYENHIAELTRKQCNFSFTVQQEQQHLLNALRGISEKLSQLENERAIVTFPPNLPALDDCAEMLRGLTKVETAGPQDIGDMIQVVQGLTESIDSFQQQSEQSFQRSLIAQSESDSCLMSHFTEQLNILASGLGNQDQIMELREAKNTLEERVRGNENLLVEVRNGRTSAEKRENDLRAGNGRLVDELAKLREIVLTTKKGTSPMNELQSLSMKWTNTNSMLAESLQRIEGKDQKLRSQEEQIRDMSEQLARTKAEQQRSVEEIQEMSDRLGESLETVQQEKEQLLAEKELYICNLQSQLKELEGKCSDQLRDFERVNLSQQTLAETLDDANHRLSQAVQDCDAAKSTIANLNQQLGQMNGFREQATRVSCLVQDCGTKDGVIASLQQELESFKATEEQLHGYQLEVENKVREIAQLNTRLRAAEETAEQLLPLQTELKKYKEEMAPLKDAQERVAFLESKLCQKTNEVTQLSIKIADENENQQQLTDLQTQMSRSVYDFECMEKKLKAAEEKAARNPELGRQISAHEDEIAMITTKLAEAERISQSVPEMQAQMDQFSETFRNLRRELEDAHQLREDLQSTRDANITLHETITDLQRQAAVAEQASDSVMRLREEMYQKDEQIITLRMELARVGVKSQRPKDGRESKTEDGSDSSTSHGHHGGVEGIHAPQRNTGNDDKTSPAKDKNGNGVLKKIEPSSNRKCANRDANIWQAYHPATSRDLALLRKPSTCTASSRIPSPETLAEHVDESHTIDGQHFEDPNVIPESQPRVDNFRGSSSASSVLQTFLDDIVSSSPLSDVGDLFDSSEQDQLAESQHCRVRDGSQLDMTASRDNGMVTKQPAGQDDAVPDQSSKRCDSPPQTHNVGKLSQESRRSPSSYGEPLLLDDLERLGSFQPSALVNTANRKRSDQSSQDLLTSPVEPLPLKLSRISTGAIPSEASSRPDLKAVDLIAYGKLLVKDPSPRRLRSRDPISRNNSRQQLQEVVNDTMNTRPATPSLPPKEKHQPNSAIKRKCESVGLSDGTIVVEKKRGRRKLSNVEVGCQLATGTRSASSSTSAVVGQTLTRLRQSSTSTTNSRAMIVGKNAPAPGTGKQGLKKPRGGSKSQRYNERFGSHKG